MSEETEQSVPPTDATPTFSELSVTDWTEKYWGAGKIGFHMDHVHPLLLKHAEQLLGGRKGLRIFFPLCGKAHDMKWLADEGHTVIGLEGVEQPIVDFFTEQGVKYTKEQLSDIEGELYKSSDGNIIIYKCNIFDFTSYLKEGVDAVWDRGSLVVINPLERDRYSSVIKSLAAAACTMITVTVDYDDSIMLPPPHVIPEEIIRSMFDSDFTVQFLDRVSDMSERWRAKGLSAYDEVLHFFTHKDKQQGGS